MISAQSNGYGSLRCVSRTTTRELLRSESAATKRAQAYVVHVKKGIGQNSQNHKTLVTMGRADKQMTLETLLLEPSSTVGHLTVLAPIKRH